MEPKPASLGSSLIVPCVQELAKESPTAVPPRYVRPEQGPPIASYPVSSSRVPIIDMDKLISGDHMELEKLDSSCKEWGFFQPRDEGLKPFKGTVEDPNPNFATSKPFSTQLINHGVSSSLVDKVKIDIQDFFNLPMEEKKKYWQKPEDVEGFGQAFVVSEEQKLDWGDMFFLTTLPTTLRKPHLFPKLPLPLRDTLEAYSMELKKLALKILDFMAEALKMKVEDTRELFEEGTQSMRMNYYPPCPLPEKVMGLTAHADAVGLTILLQINEMEGLQVKKDGMWMPIVPLPEAFVINIGDILQIITNGAYPSIEHRAIVNSSKERLSIATFYSPRYDGEMGPAPSLITPQSPSLYNRISVEEYFKGLFARELQGKSYLDTMKIANEMNKI